MKRLPDYHRSTRRAELAVFLSLGAAAVMTIAFAVADMLDFVGGSDQIAAALSVAPAALIRNADCDAEETSRTNLTSAQTQFPAAPAARLEKPDFPALLDWGNGRVWIQYRQ